MSHKNSRPNLRWNPDYLEGAKVTIYSDPITMKKPEGDAVVLNALDTEFYYQVQFENGDVCGRFVPGQKDE